MKKVEMRHKEYPGVLEFNQLYTAINDDNDILINGAVEISSDIPADIRDISVNANLCNKKNEILYVINEYDKVNVRDNDYFSFSISCCDISRLIDVSELSHVEIYVIFSRDEKRGETDER